MSGIKDLMSGRSDQYRIPLDNITIDPKFNVREDYGDINELAKNIAENGQNIAGIIRYEDGKAILVDGHRRFKAINLANKKYKADIPNFKCVKEERGANEESRIICMLSTSLGKPLTPLEQAAAIKRLIDYGYKQTEIAKKLGKTVPAVSALLALNSASHELRTAVKEKKISSSAAKVLAKTSSSKQKDVLKKHKDKKTIKVTDVEKDVNGTPSMISSKSIKEKIKIVEEKIKSDKNQGEYWATVIYGMEVALGIRKL